ncbi:MAG: ABC transporter ATP-binding protein [Hyphomicrobiales bacterium]|nr:ABC transporter ATP-binding protein [Hyphomicrobiales bacterium]MDE2115446.1 ABC transporter ATP-binding protein [Hyphomicrobiales bacterium]
MSEFAIDVQGLTKSFGTHKVVDSLDLRVAEGEICGFLGANGSGKTTTIRLLSGLLKPDAGRGQCIGFDILKQTDQIRRQIGYMTQKFSFYEDLTVFENLYLVAGIYEIPQPKSAIDKVVRDLGLAPYIQNLAGTLSGGWKQRLALAACVLHRPKLLLLDEPTAGVDVKARREFWDLLHDMAAQGITVLVSTHYMDEAARCKRIVYLANGRIVVQGDPQSLAAGSGLITFEIKADNVDALAHEARQLSGVEAAAVFGPLLHVAGTQRATLEASLHGLVAEGWREVEPTLEDVFIHLLAVGGPG